MSSVEEFDAYNHVGHDTERSSYWAIEGAHLPCRDTVNPSSDTSQYGRGYRVFGDSLFLHSADMFLDSTFIGLIFPDSVVELGVASANARRYLRRHGASSDPALLGRRLLDFSWDYADAGGDDVLIVERGKVRPEISHTTDYGHGIFTITQKAGKTEIESTLSNLKLGGAEVTYDAKCPDAEMGAMKLVFDKKSGHFARGKPYCANPRRS
jgi:hypothetical protein